MLIELILHKQKSYIFTELKGYASRGMGFAELDS